MADVGGIDSSRLASLIDRRFAGMAFWTPEMAVLNRGTEKREKPVTSPDYLQYLTTIRTKPFLLLAGISGTGKSRIVREFAFKSCPEYLRDKDGTTPGNYCMIEVKPNWHDSTELLGYYSNLSQGYQFTKFVKFLVKAKMFPDVPFFVCLDEMNLAPVEQYFAEILSILETRRHPAKAVPDTHGRLPVKTGAIVDAAHFQTYTGPKADGGRDTRSGLSDLDWYRAFFPADENPAAVKEIERFQGAHTLQEEGLTLPDNVIIIGTVNMDDTTHPFSRKVIDRAMTIEMNGGALGDLFGGSSDLEYTEDPEEQLKWQRAFRSRYVTADEVLAAHPDVAEELTTKLPARLDAVNAALKGTPFEVSYRVLNELTIMVGVMLDDAPEGKPLDEIIDAAVNDILLMKILPRIEGDTETFALSRSFREAHNLPYNDRLEWLAALAPDRAPALPAPEDAEAAEAADGAPHRMTAKEKINEMRERLNNQEFTRFWP